MKRLASVGLLTVAACGQPHGAATLTPGGAQAAVSSGPVTVSGGRNGSAASVRVVDTPRAKLRVGTNGAAVGVRPGGGPVSLWWRPGGVSLGI